MLKSIFQLRISCKKILFGILWHKSYASLYRKNDSNETLLSANEYLYDKAICTVHINGSTGRGFRRTAGVRQAVSFHSSSSIHFLEMIMSGALKEHDGKVGIDNKTITICSLKMTNSC